MNWLDWVILALLALAAFRGFGKGFVVECAALVALVVGVWVGLRYGPQLVESLGFEVDHALLVFIISLVMVVIGIHLLARLLTRVLDLTLLSFPNKLAGALFASLRSLITISLMMYLLDVYSGGRQPSEIVRGKSTLYHPVQAFVPTILGPFGGMTWVQDAARRVRLEVEAMIEEEDGQTTR